VSFRIDKKDRACAPDAIRFRIRIDNALLRLFVPSLEVEYDANTKRLRSYKGFSNVTDEEDEGQQVRIVFRPPAVQLPSPTRTAAAGLASDDSPWSPSLP
jgi:hypothetical protein